MSKKILFLILISAVLVLPLFADSAIPPEATLLLNNVAELAAKIGGAIVVVGWIIAGILFLLAAGKPEKMETAKKALFYALIGTVVVVIGAAGYTVVKGIVESALTSGT